MPLPSFLQRFRRSAPDSVATDLSATPALDVEATRTRARRQLIGMLVLVVAGVIGFPWLFETQPRPMSQDVQVVQANPGAGRVNEGEAAGRAPLSGRVGVAAITPPAVPADAGPAPSPEREIIETEPPKPETKPEIKPEPKPAVKPVAKPADIKSVVAHQDAARKPADKATDKAAADKAADKAAADKAAKLAAEKAAADKKLAEARRADAKRAEAAKSAKPAEASTTRYVVQFGAFADNTSAQAARAKVEKLGIKTYAQTIDTPAGKRTRVRVGPFATKAEADKANAAIQKAGMSGSVLTL